MQLSMHSDSFRLRGRKGRGDNGGVAQLVEQRTSNPQIRCSSPGLLAALSRGLSRKRLQVSALPRQWIRLFNGLTV